MWISAAKEAGADYAKFQTWKVSRLIDGPWDTDGRRQIYEKAELTREKHAIFKEHCEKVGIKFLTSCFCVEDIELVRGFCDEVKIPSPEGYSTDLLYKLSVSLSMFTFLQERLLSRNTKDGRAKTMLH